jgi:hypothetical protein
MLDSYLILEKIFTLTYFKKRVFILLFFLLSFQLCAAQDTPYYQLPQNRKQNHELISMPNLNAFTITYFLAASAGFKKPLLGENLVSPSAANSKAIISGFGEITLGQNRNDNWIFEFGVSQQNSYLQTSFLELRRNSLDFTNKPREFYAPFRIKKKVLCLDKVSRAAFLNVGLGVSYLIKKSKKNIEEGTYPFGQRPIPEPRDYTSLNYKVTSSNYPLALELLTEIRGKVTERLEISIFAKGFLRNNRHLYNQFTFNYVDGTSSSFGVYEKPISFLFGLQAKINSPKYYQYKSNVE